MSMWDEPKELSEYYIVRYSLITFLCGNATLLEYLIIQDDEHTDAKASHLISVKGHLDLWPIAWSNADSLSSNHTK